MDNSNHDIEYLRRCREMIEQKLSWRPAVEWRNYEFNELSEKILDETGVNLSSTTLKRLFGKLKYDSLPSSVTLNALAKYVGFSSWMELKSMETLHHPDVLQVKEKTTQFHRRTWLAGAAVLLIGVVTTVLFVSGKSSHSINHEEAIVFQSKPVTEGLPNSVVFNVDLKGNKPDNIIIQQYWDSTKTVRLQQGQTEATGIYYYPGYFRAKLILDGRIVKEHDLFIRSDKWMATIDREPVPSYLDKTELVFDNKMDVSEKVLDQIRTIPSPTYLTYHLVKPFDNLASGNFTLEASIRNTYGKEAAVCKTAKIFVLCTKGAFIIPFTTPGCISDINFKANDYYLLGKSSDLSGFGADISDWSAVKVETKDQRIRIYLNDRLIREAVYQQDAGDVVGLRFSFLGAGAVKYVSMKRRNGEIAYEDNFN